MIINITEYLNQSAKQHPQKIAFSDKSSSITFYELFNQSRELAKIILHETENRTSVPIAVCLPKCVDCIVCFMAAAYSGNFYSPIDISMPKARVKSVMNALEPAVILTNTANLDFIATLNSGAKVIDIDKLFEFEASDHMLKPAASKVIDTDPLYVMFTSGSTGTPKGVVISHRSVIDYTEWLAETFLFSEKTVFGNQAPFYFDNSVLDIYSTLRNASETVIVPEELFLTPVKTLRYLDEQNVNTIFWVPSALALAYDSDALNKYTPHKLGTILFAGEVMQNKSLNYWRRHLPNALYANLYGPTEIAVDCTYYIVDREFSDNEPLPIGIPCKNTDILVLNGQDRLVSGGEIGELCVRGTCLSMGYYGNDEKTEVSFTQNPMNLKYPEKIYRTGDLVRYNERGELMYIGRKDYQIKHMGHRIELGEIETAALGCDDVTGSCAIYDGSEKRIILYCTPELLDKKAVYRQLKSALPRYMLPSLIEAIKEFPLNANGKIDRNMLIDGLLLPGSNEP